MLIYIIHSDNISTFRLPKDVSGNYMLTDTDSNGKNRSLINISASGGKWFFNSNYDVKIVENGIPFEQKEVMPYSFYALYYFEREYVYLYVLPSYENNYVLSSVNGNCNLFVGRDTSCDIVYDNIYLSPKHMQLTYENGVWKANLLDGKVPFYVNKKSFNGNALNNFDCIFLMGLRIVFLNNTLVIMGPSSKLGFNSKYLYTNNVKLCVENKKSKEIVKDFYSKNDYFYKSPIFKKKYDEYEVTITPPEAKPENTNGNIFAEVIPSLLMGLTSFVSLYYAFANKNEQNEEAFVTNIVMCVVFLVTGILWPFVERIASKIRLKRAQINRVKNYKKYLARKEEELKTAVDKERSVLYFNNISLEECQEAILSKNANLYSRSIENSYFLRLKCGTGRVKSSVKIDYSKVDAIVQEDSLYDDIDKLIEKYRYIDDAGFIVNLRNTSLAVINSQEKYVSFMNALILQLASLHDYLSLKLVVLTKPGSSLNNIRNLSHCWNNDRSFRYYATSLHEAEDVSSELMKEIAKMKANDKNGMIDSYYVIISDCVENYKGLKIIDYVAKNGKNSNMFSLLLFADKVTNIPTGCNYFIDYNENESTFFNSEMDEKQVIKFKPSCINSSINFGKCIEKLSNIPIKLNANDVSSSMALPTKFGFLEMYGVGKIDQLNVLERWKNSSISSTLQAPVGIDTSGNILSLDLHEKKHGPHGLIAGMTGSGKSEFIVTYILSLAINYSPDEVQFVLIDYKGGGLAGAFENRMNNIKLPHLVGTITNLDKAEMNRTLVSIKSELQRRQRVFNVAKEKLNTGSIDIYKYQMLVRDGSLTEPMSHLFIICDEFAELKAQQPDFMDELVSAARIGRSLGVHLILATQKPSGVVDDQIWSNAKFKVCCKVQTADDSNEMLRKPDAAYIKEAGRFYLQVGYDEYYALAQSGYSGVQYIPSEVVALNTDNSISFVDDSGNIYRNTSLKKNSKDNNGEEKKSLGEELGNILNYIIKIAKDNNYKTHQLWLDNIPKQLYYADVVKKYPDFKTSAYNINPLIGEFDDPETQSQGYVSLQLTGAGNTIILGNAGAGKTTLLSTMLYSTIIRHSKDEINFYILDFGAEKFNIFRQAPQVGDVLNINDTNKISYFFYMIEGELQKRQKYYSEHGGDFVLDVKSNKPKFPNIVIIIHGLEVFKEMFMDLYETLFLPIIRMSSKVGIEFVITAATSTGMGLSLDSNIKQYVLLHLQDESDYTYLIKNGHVPSNNPGRGLMEFNGKPVEFQTSLICEEIQQKDYLESIIVQLKKIMPNPAKRVPDVPKKVSLSDYLSSINNIKEVPLGVNILTAQEVRNDFSRKISLFSSASSKNTVKFFEKYSYILTRIPKSKLIILNSESEMNLRVDQNAKYYDKSFGDIVKLLYNNCSRINNEPNENNFIILIIGYTGLNNHLRELKKEDESIRTLDELVLVSTNDNFKFLIYDRENNFSKLYYTEISDLIDNTNGIWIGVDYDGQSAFEMQNISNEINASNDMVVKIDDTVGQIVKYPIV